MIFAPELAAGAVLFDNFSCVATKFIFRFFLLYNNTHSRAHLHPSSIAANCKQDQSRNYRIAKKKATSPDCEPTTRQRDEQMAQTHHNNAFTTASATSQHSLRQL